MEKSQWDLKQIHFQRKKMTRLDDFVDTYKVTFKALLREYANSQRKKKKVRSSYVDHKHLNYLIILYICDCALFIAIQIFK